MGKKLYITFIGGLVPLLAATVFAVMPAAAQATTCEESYEQTAALTHDATEPTTYNRNVGPAVNATEACWHWFSNGLPPANAAREKLSGKHVPIVSWSEELTLTNTVNGHNVTCKNVIGAWNENPGKGADGPPGVNETQAFDPYECESNACFPEVGGSGPDTYISVAMETWDEPTLPNTVGVKSEENGDAANLDWKGHLVLPSGTSPEGKFARLKSEGVRVHVTCHINTGFDAEGEPTYAASEETSTGSNEPECGAPVVKPHVGTIAFNAGSGELLNGTGEPGKTTGVIKSLGYNAQETIDCGLG
jgi:hypothetical protein